MKEESEEDIYIALLAETKEMHLTFQIKFNYAQYNKRMSGLFKADKSNDNWYIMHWQKMFCASDIIGEKL